MDCKSKFGSAREFGVHKTVTLLDEKVKDIFATKVLYLDMMIFSVKGPLLRLAFKPAIP